MGIIVFSIPIFFLLMGLELAYAAWSGRRLFRMNDAIADLSCGILSQISGIFSKFLTVGIYIWVEKHWAIQRWLPGVGHWPSGSPFTAWDGFPWFAVKVPEFLSWLTVFILVDFAFYWSHRYAHEINVLWAGHVVHHSSEEYNLAVALRQSSLHGLMSWVFYVPLALLGIPWTMYVATFALNLLYQFWIHTRAVGKMSRLTEWILNTPSHHRVHHGANPKYLDTNYGGVFIVFDRLFGTFQEEEEEPVYGLTTPLASWNPLWANLHVFWDIAKNVRRATSWRDRFYYVFGPPGWRPESEGGRMEPPEVPPQAIEKYDPEIPASLAWYGFAQFVVVLVASALLLRAADSLPLHHTAALGFYITVSLAGIAGVFEAARWAGPIETWRLVVLGAATALLGWTGAIPVALAVAGVVFCILSLAWFLPRRGHLTETELAPIM